MRPTFKSLAVMLALCGLAAAATCHAGDLVARQGNDEVRLSDAPCTDAGTLARIPAEQRAAFQQATGRFGGRAFTGCWESMGNTTHIMWEDGDQGFVPLVELRPAMDI